ncbi:MULTISPECIES: hypothetical protein [unclassified Streptomyces]|uniref:hypothetical protein n=1 Tax=unclassified Streptomyces TaxID=2593676 RepID=UPI000AA747D2|nr:MULTISPECIES: hypothetical protein [unclassified Streptomyces]
MESTGRMSDFLEAVDVLRDGELPRTTAHTASVSAEGWAADSAPAEEGEEGAQVLGE